MKWRAGLPVAKKWVYENARVVTCGHLISLLLQKGPGNKPKDLFIKAKDFSECNFKKVRWGRRTNWKSALPQKRLQVWEIQTHSHHIQAWLCKQDHTNNKRLRGVSRPPKTTPAAGSCCCCCERAFRVWKRFFMGGEKEETLALWARRPGWCLPERADNRQDFWNNVLWTDESQPEVFGHLNRGQVGQGCQLGSPEEKSLWLEVLCWIRTWPARRHRLRRDSADPR